jgi:hypothetical protein
MPLPTGRQAVPTEGGAGPEPNMVKCRQAFPQEATWFVFKSLRVTLMTKNRMGFLTSPLT